MHSTRRLFLKNTALTAAALNAPSLLAQLAGERPARAEGVTVLNPRARVPVGLIIDDSTCLVNLNRFTMPQFDQAFVSANKTYHRDWREFIECLNANQVEFLIVGALAVARHVRPRYTKDMDVWVNPTVANGEKVLSALRQFGFPIVNVKATEFAHSDLIL